MNKILKWKEVWFQFYVCAISSDLCERVILEEGFWVNKFIEKNPSEVHGNTNLCYTDS